MRQLLSLALGDPSALNQLGAVVQGWEICRAGGLAEAQRLLRGGDFLVGVLLIDVKHSAFDAIDAFLREHGDVHWVAVFHPQSMQQAACRQLVHQHCCDFHTWPLDRIRLNHTLGHAHGLASLRIVAGTRSVPQPAGVMLHGIPLIGLSPAIARLREQIRKVAATSAPVLIWGESGSGKELAAQAVHAHSARAAGPFVPINCGAIPASLIQAELFGHERGAFTGAVREKRGLIESAEGGSLFLDEIGDLPLELQANLLRFLQEKTVHRIGASHSVAVNVRVIAASHVNLQQAVQQGTFREDLYYRLNVLALDVPPLRERRADLNALAEHFFNVYAAERAPQLKGFSDKALQAIGAHPWPGNVRELINRVRRAMVMADGRLITPHDLGLDDPAAHPDGEPLDDARIRAERAAIQLSLQRAGSNITVAARDLGVSRMTLYRLLAKHGIVPSVSHSCDTGAAPATSRARHPK
ncbi:MAG: sigma-54 dependent transcriptional regulator [Pseudomonadota bacterium]